VLLSVYDALRAADRRPSKVISKALRAGFQRINAFAITFEGRIVPSNTN
jgi:hypothetical protein